MALDPLSTLTTTAEFEQPLREMLAIAAGAMREGTMASIALRRDDGPRTVAYSAPAAVALDALQFSAGAGPCVEAIESGEPAGSDDLAAESRWSGPAAGLSAQGVRSVHAMPLAFGGQVQGTLNLYSELPGGFPSETMAAAAVTAGQAAVLFQAVLQSARLEEVIAQLRAALNTRAVIDQALGIIMARRQCTAPAAFDILRRSSQRRNVKVHLVAADLVEAVSGQPPLPPHFGDPPPRSRSAGTAR
jgi:GAF domain-containing protein